MAGNIKIVSVLHFGIEGDSMNSESPHGSLHRPTEDELKEIIQKHELWLTPIDERPDDQKEVPGAYRANLNGYDLTEMELVRTDLRRATIVGSDLTNANFRSADLSEAVVRASTLDKASFDSATIREADFRDCTFVDTDLKKADLRASNFRACDLHYANLDRTDLREACLRDTSLWRTSLFRADLRWADLRSANVDHAENWEKAYKIRLANIHGVKNVPSGFLDWAEANGAVAVESDEEWDKFKQDGWERLWMKSRREFS